MLDINKWERDFMIENLKGLLSFRGRNNFTNMSRYLRYNEATIRSWYEKYFNYLFFNIELIKTLKDELRIIAFDPSYVSKSGQLTPGLGYFWSGCVNSTKRGLEITGIASVGLESKTAMHLEAHQTFKSEDESFNLLTFYANLILSNVELYKQVSDSVVVDAYFSRFTFVDPIVEKGFIVISKLAKNAFLRYRNTEPPTGKRGRPKVYGEKVKFNNLDQRHFTLCFKNENSEAFEAEVHSKSLKRWIKCVVVVTELDNGKTRREILFSTDINQSGSAIIERYRLRFQIEFLFRDAKQFTGLTHCQARSKNKIHNHINMSLTAVSVAKALHYFDNKTEEKEPFSLSSIKMLYFNRNYIQRIFKGFGIAPEPYDNSEQMLQIERFGCIAA
ncbi:transposase [Persicobacter diffluens]